MKGILGKTGYFPDLYDFKSYVPMALGPVLRGLLIYYYYLRFFQQENWGSEIQWLCLSFQSWEMAEPELNTSSVWTQVCSFTVSHWKEKGSDGKWGWWGSWSPAWKEFVYPAKCFASLLYLETILDWGGSSMQVLLVPKEWVWWEVLVGRIPQKGKERWEHSNLHLESKEGKL